MTKLLSSLAIATSLIFSGTDALLPEKRDGPAVVTLDLAKVMGIRTSGSLRPELARRGYDEATINNENFLWTVSLQIGNPPQTTRCQLDTGSSDLVTETGSSDLCQSSPAVCGGRGTYNANSSSTYQYVNSKLNVAYGGGDSATGDYAIDYLNIGNDLISVQFGIMYHTTVQECIMGVSFTTIEGSLFSYGQQYPNIPQALVNQGYIASNAYSVWLNDDTAASGKLLFGGIDSNKYYGNLVTLPFVTGPNDNAVRQTYVTLQSVQMTRPSGQTITLNGGLVNGPALFDTGTTFIYIPPALAQSIYTELNATQLNGGPNGPYYVLCNEVTSTETLDFLFNGITIHVPLRQLIYDPPGPPFYTYCELGIIGSNSFTILGDTFLTSIYAVFDLDNKKAHIAPAVYGSTTDNITPIGSGPNAVPSVSGQPVPGGTTTTSTTSTTSSTSTTSRTSTSSTTSTTSTSSTTSSSTSSRSTTSSKSSSSSSTTTSKTSTTSTTMSTSTTTAKPTLCRHDNCYRAVVKPSNTAFCSSYLAGSIPTAPSLISKGCSATASKISSACSCLQTGG